MIEVEDVRVVTLDPVLVVGGDHDRDANLMKSPENIANLVRRIDVEVAGWLVGEQYGGAIDDRAGDGQPLLLAPGKRDAFSRASRPTLSRAAWARRIASRRGCPTICRGSSTLSRTLRSNSSFWS